MKQILGNLNYAKGVHFQIRNIFKNKKRSLVWPEYQIIEENEPFRINCQSFNSTPSWTVNRKHLHSHKIKEGSVAVKHAELSDEGLYRCRIKIDGHTIQSTAVVDIQKLINKRIKPAIKGFKIGSTVFFTCDSVDDIVWTYRGGRLPLNAKPKGDRLYIYWARKINQGQYECHGTYKGDKVTDDDYKLKEAMFVAKGTLLMYKKQLMHPQKQRVVAGNKVNISCNAPEHAEIIWRHKERPMKFSNVQVHDNVLSIDPVKVEHHGLFECVGKSIAGPFIGYSILEVVDTNYWLYPSKLVVRKGETVTFTCTSDTPVIWKYDNKKVPFLGIKTRHTPGTREYTLTIKRAKEDHTGVYSCEGNDFNAERGILAKGILKVIGKTRKKIIGHSPEYKVTLFTMLIALMFASSFNIIL